MLRQFSCRCALVLSVIAFGGAAQAGMMLDGVPSSSYEAYALNPLYHASGWLTAADSSGTLVSWGSAVLIDPHWILMSGHQLYGKTYSTVQFGLGSNILTSPGETRSVTATYWYPDYAGGVGGSTNDIALGYLVDPILDVLPAARFTGAVGVGTHVSIIGYGMPGTPSTGVGLLDGVERGGENLVDKIGWSVWGIGTNYALADFGPFWFTDSLPFEFGATPGDSGGGWYDDQGELVGVSGFGWGPPGQPTFSGAIRVSLYNSWIDQTIGSTVPEPATWIVFASGIPFVGLLVRRRRRQAAGEG
jgi:hypothetical protein